MEREPLAGAANMAVDSSLLGRAREGVAFLRMYRWAPPCLSFGRNEPAATRYDANTIRALGLDTVRRPTGGRAVWHEHEVTYAVAGPADMFGSLADAYIAIHQMIAAALRGLGIGADVAPRPPARVPGPGDGACFAMPVGGEVIVAGMKLVGSAQVREGGAFLQHGSILLENGQRIVSRVTRGTPPAPAATSIAQLLGSAVGFGDVRDAIIAQFRAIPGGEWEEEPATYSAADLARFRDPAWTWRR
jgi:lipoate-protein ligase A